MSARVGTPPCSRGPLARGFEFFNSHNFVGSVPSPPRYYGLMCQSWCLPATMHGGSWLGLCRLDHPRLVSGTFPTLSLRIFPCVLGPLPRQLSRCMCPFLPARQRPSPREDRVGAQPHPVQRRQHGASFRGCSHSLTFRPAGLLATQVAPTATDMSVWQP